MTDFAQEPLWEEEKAPLEPPKPARIEEQKPDAMAAAGSAAMAQALDPEPALTQPPEPTQAPASMPEPLTEPVPETEPEPAVKAPKATQPRPAPAQQAAAPDPTRAKPAEPPMPDWQAPLQALLQNFEQADLERALPPVLDLAVHIPEAQVQAVAGAVISAFVQVPLGLRKTKRDGLIKALSNHPELPLARLVLVRLGGIAPAPPAPAADGGGA